MQGTFFVNSASLFMLSSIIESGNSKRKDSGKELTTVTMPSALIEGAETIVFFSLFILMPEYLDLLFGVFSLGVVVNICQRLHWAYNNLDQEQKNQ